MPSPHHFTTVLSPLTSTCFSGIDVAALTMLSHAPFHYFLYSFYAIRPTTSAVCVAIDVISAAAPFYLLKVSSSIHSIVTAHGVAVNRSVINDLQTQVTIILLASCIYGLMVLSSYGSWLPTYIMMHFDGVRDISKLYNSYFPFLAASFVPLGFAAKIFLFTPATAAKPDRYDKEITSFDTEEATL